MVKKKRKRIKEKGEIHNLVSVCYLSNPVLYDEKLLFTSFINGYVEDMLEFLWDFL